MKKECVKKRIKINIMLLFILILSVIIVYYMNELKCCKNENDIKIPVEVYECDIYLCNVCTDKYTFKFFPSIVICEKQIFDYILNDGKGIIKSEEISKNNRNDKIIDFVQTGKNEKLVITKFKHANNDFCKQVKYTYYVSEKTYNKINL